MAADALSTTKETTAFDSEEYGSEAAFTKAEKKIWDRAMRRELARIKAKASGAPKAVKGNTLGKNKRCPNVSQGNKGVGTRPRLPRRPQA